MAKGRVIVELDDGTEHVLQGPFRYDTTVTEGKAEVAVTITMPDAVVVRRRSSPDEILHSEVERMRTGLRDICAGLNGFTFHSPIEILIVARMALTGRPRGEIEAEHIVHLTPGESRNFAVKVLGLEVEE